ncbi:MAG: ftsL1 [Actinoallomurus sp.]|jgi:hypothetical protein|nr:ftsL1 [Actinoallomurus sp.]
MKTMTSPPEVRTQADATSDAPSRIGRRRGVPPPRGVTRRTARTPERRVAVPARRPVRTVERRATTAPQAPFAVLVVGLLGGALVSLLLLNTVLAQQAFTVGELQQENQRLDERKQALQEDITRETGPEVLHAKARRLGMRDAGHPVYLDPRVPSAR